MAVMTKKCYYSTFSKAILFDFNSSLNVIKNDGNATDDSGIDSIEQNNSSPEPLLLRFKDSHFKKDSWKREFVLQRSEPAELTSVRKKVEVLEVDQQQVRVQKQVIFVNIIVSYFWSSTNFSQNLNKNAINMHF